MIIREATCADVTAIARVHVDSWRTTYRGLVPSAYLGSLTYAGSERIWTGALCAGGNSPYMYVAEGEAGVVVGFAAAGPERMGDPVYTGELYAIYLLATHQGQGLGRRLVAAVAARLRTAGYPALLIWVLACNPACRFYVALGGRPVRTQPITIGGAALEEVAYGWPDCGTLVSIDFSGAGAYNSLEGFAPRLKRSPRR